MKRLFVLLLASIAVAINMSVSAQEKSDENRRISREKLAETQAKYIAQELALDDATAEKYVSTYCAYQRELWQLGPRVKHHQGELSDADVEKAMQEQFERSGKIVELRKKYYDVYVSFMNPKKVQKAFELERKVMKRLQAKHRAGKGKAASRGDK